MLSRNFSSQFKVFWISSNLPSGWLLCKNHSNFIIFLFLSWNIKNNKSTEMTFYCNPKPSNWIQEFKQKECTLQSRLSSFEWGVSNCYGESTQSWQFECYLTPCAYCRNRLLFSVLPKFSRYFCLYARTVSTCVLCFTASSRALQSKVVNIV